MDALLPFILLPFLSFSSDRFYFIFFFWCCFDLCFFIVVIILCPFTSICRKKNYVLWKHGCMAFLNATFDSSRNYCHLPEILRITKKLTFTVTVRSFVFTTFTPFIVASSVTKILQNKSISPCFMNLIILRKYFLLLNLHSRACEDVKLC